MPVNITPEMGHSGGHTAPAVDFGEDLGYEYPDGLNLRPKHGNTLHKRIQHRVYDAADDSYGWIQQRHASWNKIDETMTAFIETSEYEKRLKTRKNRDGDLASIKSQ